jgi:excisionase family DNA binding protein
MYQPLATNSEPSHAASEDLLTADEVAGLLRMTPAWVYAETRRNRIPHMRLGRYFRYRRSAIEAWIREIETGPDPATLAAPNSHARRPRQAPVSQRTA